VIDGRLSGQERAAHNASVNFRIADIGLLPGAMLREIGYWIGVNG
jgi:hypothetical protein